MHEMSRAKKLVKQLVDVWVGSHASAIGLRSATSVKVRVSPLAGVDKDELVECFQIVATGTPVEGWQMEVVSAPFFLHCLTCGKTFSSEKPEVVCPNCASEELSVEPQDEMWIEQVSFGEICETKVDSELGGGACR